MPETKVPFYFRCKKIKNPILKLNASKTIIHDNKNVI